jgi:hypothetical protein
MLTTTLSRIRGHRPCQDGWENLLAGLGKTKADDEPVPYATILRINGLDDALWCCRAEPQHDREWRLMAVRFAREVQHLMTDPHCIAALDVAERFAKGEATEAELAAAWAAAWAARDAARAAAWVAGAAAWAAWDAAGAAAGAAAWAAWDAAGAAAWAAAWAAWDAAGAAAWAARDAARDAAWAAAGAAAWAARDAARATQTRIFLETVGEE